MQEVQVKYESEKVLVPLTIDDVRNSTSWVDKKLLLLKWYAWLSEQRKKDLASVPSAAHIYNKKYVESHREKYYAYLKEYRRKKRESKLNI